METPSTSKVEIPSEVQDMAKQIYDGLLKEKENRQRFWRSPDVLRMYMKIEKEQEPLFMKGFWLLIIQDLIEPKPDGLQKGYAFRLKSL